MKIKFEPNEPMTVSKLITMLQLFPSCLEVKIGHEGIGAVNPEYIEEHGLYIEIS